METEYISSQKEIYEHYRGQVMLLKHIADSIDGAEFDLQRQSYSDCPTIAWNEKFKVTFPNLEYAPTEISIEIQAYMDGRYDDEIGYIDTDSVRLDHSLYGIIINDECYFEGSECNDATLLEVITLEREKLKQTEQEVLEEKLTYGAYNSKTDMSRAIQKDLIDEPDAPIVKLYSQIEYLNNIEKIILEYETK
jgi:hypothetical protein